MESSRNKKQCPLSAKWYLAVACLTLCIGSSAWSKWKPADGPLMTKWASEVTPDNVHQEYPRPQMVRKDWLNLNGLWSYAIQPKDEPKPADFGGQILVPFPAESALSGVMKAVGQDNRLWYRRTFKIPRKWGSSRILLHFEAVDWDTTVWVNGEQVGTHRGGYDPFTFDITDVLKKSGPQELVLSVWDPTNAGHQPRGKQVKNPRGIWYTAVTGIWRTVWLEPVNPIHIRCLKMEPDIDAGILRLQVEITGEVQGPGKFMISAEIPGMPRQRNMRLGEKVFWFALGPIGEELEIHVKDPKLWSPDSPFLYELDVSIGREGSRKSISPPGPREATTTMVELTNLDRVRSYFGMRKIEVHKDEHGINRLFLNNKPLFQYGPLDQGWWPDGLYAAPTDAALRYDIEVLKKLGCNMMRKHVKVEPRRFYYWCDKLGLMVWQDMPNGDRHIGGRDPDLKRSEESAQQFELELTRVIDSLRNHPSIIMWVPFNEGWGQYDTPRIVDLIKKHDPTRLVDNASGWTDRGVGDVHDIHRYPGPAAPPVEEKRAAVLGEFGGLGLPVKGHTWQDEKNWGYRTYKTRDKLTDAYVALLENLRSLIGGGLSAAVYTQTTDVEIEVNGLMTYDRAMVKMDADRAAAANRRLYLPPPIVKTVVPTSQSKGQEWRYTMSEPADGWELEDFDDSAWKRGIGGFGTVGTPGAIVRTEWKGSDIWIRREFKLKATKLNRPYVLIHHDEDAQVYINGRLVTKLEDYTSSYVRVALDEKGRAVLRRGSNCLAVHCHQTGGGQYIDVGLVDVIEQSTK